MVVSLQCPCTLFIMILFVCFFIRCLPGYPYKCPKLQITLEKGLTKSDADNLLCLLQDQVLHDFWYRMLYHEFCCGDNNQWCWWSILLNRNLFLPVLCCQSLFTLTILCTGSQSFYYSSSFHAPQFSFHHQIFVDWCFNFKFFFFGCRRTLMLEKEE